MKRIYAKPGAALWLGRRGEDDAREVVFDLSYWKKRYGEGSPELIVQRPGEGYRYPVALTIEGRWAYWAVTEADTDIPGSTGTAELRYYTEDGNAKSEIWRTEILASKDSPIGTPPEPYQDWVDRVLQAGMNAKDLAETVHKTVAAELTRAKESGEFDGEDGYTPVKGVDYFDGVDGKDGIPGADGYTPVKGVDYFDGQDGATVVSLERTSGTGAAGTYDTYTMIRSDGQAFTFQVYNGADGKGSGDMLKSLYDPQNRNTDIFDYVDKAVSNLDVDVTADEVTFSDGESFQQKYDSGELKGQDGSDGAAGQDGSDGVSPTVSVAAITGGHRITITDAHGTKTVDVMDGSDGAAGKDGSSGADGVGVASVEQTTTSTDDGGENIITVTLTNGTKYTFTVKNGSKGSTGAAGNDGTNGKDATINGVNALTLTTDEYLSLEQTGSTAKLSMKSAPASLTTVTAVLSSSAWAQDSDGLYAQTVSVTGVTTDPNQVIVADVQQTGADLDADNEALAGWAGEDGKGPSTQYVTQGNGTLTFHAIEAPTVNIPLNLGVG